jgi:hypothetical protein
MVTVTPDAEENIENSHCVTYIGRIYILGCSFSWHETLFQRLFEPERRNEKQKKKKNMLLETVREKKNSCVPRAKVCKHGFHLWAPR